MSDDPVLRTTARTFPQVVHPTALVTYGVVAAVLGWVLSLVVAGALGTTQVVGALVGGGGILAVLLAYRATTRRGGPVVFRRDRVEYDDRSVPYHSVSVAVTAGGWTHRRFGTRSVELVRHGEENLELPYLADPEEAERVLDEHLDDPERQLELVDADSRSARKPDELSRPGHLWLYWTEEADCPDGAVVAEPTLGDVLDVDVGSVDLDALDDADMSDADGLSDVDPGDVGGGGDGGATGGGFDGGGGDAGGF